MGVGVEGMSILQDIPHLTLAQFSALHMAISSQGFDYAVSTNTNQTYLSLMRWRPIARLSYSGLNYQPGSILYLVEPLPPEPD